MTKISAPDEEKIRYRLMLAEAEKALRADLGNEAFHQTCRGLWNGILDRHGISQDIRPEDACYWALVKEYARDMATCAGTNADRISEDESNIELGIWE